MNIKTVVMGVGRMGRLHVRAVRALGLDLVGVCDQRAESLQAVRTEAGLAESGLFTDAARLLQETRPELVIVATTAPAHCEYTCQAAAAGARYILCEKPMAVSLAQCDCMLAACAQHQARLAINHPMRFMPLYGVPRELLQSETLGGLSSMTVVGGNCGMAMNATHKLEAFRWFTGEAPHEVRAWFSPDRLPNPRGPEFFDMAGSLRVSTASGRRLFIDISADQGHGVLSLYAGRHGWLTVDEMTGVLTLNARQAQFRGQPTHQYWNPHDLATRQLPPSEALGPAQAVLRALLADDDYPTGDQARSAVAALVAGYVSHERGGAPVLVDAALPASRLFPWA